MTIINHPWGETIENVPKRERTQPARVPTWVDAMHVYECTVAQEWRGGINYAPVRYLIAPNELAARVHARSAGLVFGGKTSRDAVEVVRGGYSSLRLVVLP